MGAIPAGERKLTVTAVRSDGHTTKTSVDIVVDPPGRRTVFLKATRADGKVVSAAELAKTRLVIEEDGRDVGSCTVEAAGARPLHFGLLVDVSSSMRADKKLAKVKEALSAFIGSMGSQDRAFLIKYADTPELVLDFTANHWKLRKELEFFTANGGSALYDAVQLGQRTGSGISSAWRKPCIRRPGRRSPICRAGPRQPWVGICDPGPLPICPLW